jgi:hypothetical protein
MNERERDLAIKEARMGALHDLQLVFATIESERGPQDELGVLAKLVRYHIGQKLSEVAQDKAGGPKVSHTLWGE